MFDTIQSIWEAIRNFEKVTNRRPNVLFVNDQDKYGFIRMLHREYMNTAERISYPIYYPLNFEDIVIFGLKIRFTNSLEGVDYISEIDEMYRQPIEKKSVKIKSNKRKIIL
jgi:hypothetical protein